MQSENVSQGVVVVLASFMMDLVARAPRRPRAGESVFGTDFGMFVGGKGCNQAIAAARLGASVRVIGRLGEDLFAPFFLNALEREGIDASWIARDAEAGTGVAMPLIEPSGQNSIVAIPRANWRVTEEQIAAAADALSGAAALLTGFEIAMPAVLAALRLARERGVLTLLNPAPAPDPVPPLDDPMWRLVDVLLPNESEAESLSGVPVRDLRWRRARRPRVDRRRLRLRRGDARLARRPLASRRRRPRRPHRIVPGAAGRRHRRR